MPPKFGMFMLPAQRILADFLEVVETQRAKIEIVDLRVSQIFSMGNAQSEIVIISVDSKTDWRKLHSTLLALPVVEVAMCCDSTCNMGQIFKIFGEWESHCPSSLFGEEEGDEQEQVGEVEDEGDGKGDEGDGEGDSYWEEEEEQPRDF